MVIFRITPTDVLNGCRQVLGLPADHSVSVDDTLLAGLLRRSAGIHCPCSRATLRASLLESLQYLHTNGAPLSDRIDAAIEALIVGGDLLELTDIVTDDPAVLGTWVFAAPPSFVVRPSGGVFLFGIVPDQDAFLPRSLATRIRHDGFTRLIVPRRDDNLSAELHDEGLQRLSESTWLKSPRTETAADLLGRFERNLATQPSAGVVSDLEILDTARPVAYYRGRWTVPKNHSGNFVARRPREFGAPAWCFVHLDAGTPVRLLDLPPKKTRWRACDVAWHLQMAVDFCRHTPQHYRRRDEQNGVRFEFFSPLPQWAQRRLMILGRVVSPEHSLMAYVLPGTEAQTEERFLQERLWLSRTEDSR